MRFAWRMAGCGAVVAMCALLGACAMYGHALRDVELALQQGRPADALARLDQLDAGFRNEALYYISKGMLLRMNGDIAGSVAAFEAAKPLMIYQEATSISETAGRFALAEGTTSYQPRPFERLQLHVLQAINQLELGNWDGARVEALQIDLLLRREYDGVAPEGGDAFARYLSGIIFEGLQEDDNALIAYRKALEAYDRNGALGRVPEDLQLRLLMLTDRVGLDAEHDAYVKRFGEDRNAQAEALAKRSAGEVIVVATTGLVPQRYEVSSLHQDITSGKFYRISLPALRERSGSARRVVLVEDQHEIGRAERVEDLSAAAQRALDDELPGLIARSIARNIVKNRVANEAGENSQGMEFLLNFASAVLENADTRSWSTLPDAIYLLRATLPPGEHHLRVEFVGAGGGALESRDMGSVNVSTRRPVVAGVHRVSY